ncbi:winged helix-turn-helix transcriptional regulator [Amycolatopsis acidicola]|uniref:Winged helix-turn-helix transcriptional regulator n=1 Tax=Amycolatopsis acidicola TaxID=2596893 RepID=A0A5N0UH55_9PSEU|nr:winged helix-turn-helix domain-containing protein [Amycolatopsis acidicola]KAA9147822.1 winged helix-turn-helix transcriptional regulator [Amycolatopsis acidicola]
MTMTLTRLEHDDGAVELRIVVPGAQWRPEVAARLAEVLEPAAEPPARIEVEPRRVFAAGAEITLTRLEFDLLLFLCRNAGRVCDRRSLLRHVWHTGERGGGRTIDVHIRKLRAKIGVLGSAITTIRGVGYRFDGRELVRVEQSPF